MRGLVARSQRACRSADPPALEEPQVTLRLNAAWHAKHPMPKNPTLDERVAWHVAHARACGCRDLPKSVLAALRARGDRVPRRRQPMG